MKFIKNFESFRYKTINEEPKGMSFHLKGDVVADLFIDDKKIGDMHYRIKNNIMHIVFISIYNEYRSIGYGDKIMFELESKAKKENCDKIDLEVLNTNKVAINLYKKHGFQLESESGSYYIMSKVI